MGRKIYPPEKIVRKLREAEVLISQGNTIAQASRLLGITEQTYYRWRSKFGGMEVSDAKKLKSLEKDTVIIEEGTEGETMYIIKSGSVKVTKHQKGVNRTFIFEVPQLSMPSSGSGPAP